MGQTLSHGVYLPAEGERNCYSGLASNWNLLDTAIGDTAGKASATHTHGNISNDGKVGTTANLPLITGTGGAVQAGAFGNQANTFCEGNDSRLSDARTPVAHTHTKSDVTDLLNSNFIPSANNSYDLGSSSYQWNNLYAKNYYYNGVEFQNKFVTLDSVQTISGEKTFSKSVKVSVGSSEDSGYTVIANVSRKDVGDGKYYGTYIHAGVASGLGVLGVYGYIRNTDGTSELQMRLITSKSDGNFILKALQFQADRYGDTWQFIPSTNNTINLGTSSKKWKTLNGINPGALSFPDYTQYEPINFSQWNTSGALTNTYTPTEDGWLFVNIKDTATNSIYIYVKSIPGAQNYSVSVYGNGSQGSAGRLATIMPVIKGLTYGVVIKASSVNDIYAVTFFPALGNV